MHDAHVSGKNSLFLLYSLTTTTLTTLHFTSKNRYVGFFSPYEDGCPTIQFNSILTLTDVRADPTDCANPPTPKLLLMDLLLLGGSQDPLFRFNHVLELFTELRETLCLFIIKQKIQ